MTRLLALTLLFGLSTTIAADPGLDLIILADRSTSMAHQPRADAPLLLLTVDLLARNATANRIEHRIAVIGFGSAATVDIPFTRVRPATVPALRERIAGLRHEDRGDTDVLAAFTAAKSLFETLGPAPDRRRAIVLVTDGVPYVRGTNMSAYRTALRDFAATHFAQGGVTVDVLLIGARNDSIWQGIGTSVVLAGRGQDQLLAQAHGIITRVAGTRTAESAPAKAHPAVETLIVPPYLEVIVFDIFRATPAERVEVFPPGARVPVRAGVGGVESVRLGDALATLVVPRPAPGEWTIRKSAAGARVRVLSQQFFPRGVLVRPSPTERLRQCERVVLAYRVIDGSGAPLRTLRDYAIAVDLLLAKPDGTTVAVAVEQDASLGASTFRSVNEVFCGIDGRYWTDVRITTVDARGRHLDVFRDRWSGFSVAASPRPCTANEKTAPARNSATAWRRSWRAWLWLVFGPAVVIVAMLVILAWQKTRS